MTTHYPAFHSTVRNAAAQTHLRAWRPPSMKLVFLAWGIGSTVCNPVGASMLMGTDPTNFITTSTWVPLGIMGAVLISTIIPSYKIGRWVERQTNRIAALEKKGKRR